MSGRRPRVTREPPASIPCSREADAFATRGSAAACPWFLARASFARPTLHCRLTISNNRLSVTMPRKSASASRSHCRRAPAGRLECPLCGATGRTRARSSQRRATCALCRGRGSVSHNRIVGLFRTARRLEGVRLAAVAVIHDAVQWTADLMQVGDADSAARVSRIAFRLAGAVIVREQGSRPRSGTGLCPFLALW